MILFFVNDLANTDIPMPGHTLSSPDAIRIRVPPRWSLGEQALSLAGALATQLNVLLLDSIARVTAGLYRALLLQHHLPRRIGAVLTQEQQGVEVVAFH